MLPSCVLILMQKRLTQQLSAGESSKDQMESRLNLVSADTVIVTKVCCYGGTKREGDIYLPVMGGEEISTLLWGDEKGPTYLPTCYGPTAGLSHNIQFCVCKGSSLALKW